MDKTREKRPLYTYSDKSTYEGEWIGIQADGFGIFIGSKNDRYEGQFKNNNFHGIGKYTWSEGREYLG